MKIAFPSQKVFVLFVAFIPRSYWHGDP